MRKTRIRFFTIADFVEEEKWLRDQHRNGWKILKMTFPCFYSLYIYLLNSGNIYLYYSVNRPIIN